MIKDIKYSGYSAQPSDYECPEGDLALSLNLISEENQVKTIGKPKQVLALQSGESVLFIHNVPGQKNYILSRGNTSGTFSLYWLVKTDETTDTSGAALIGNYESLKDITAVGNTLVLALESGLKYTLWKDDDYHQLKNRPPFISIDFGMYKVSTLTDSGDFNASSRCLPSYPSQRPAATSAQLGEFTQGVYALLNSAIAEKVTKVGYFYQPFFVRYAFRLYDGTYSWHSAPILMLPTILMPYIRFTKYDGGGGQDETSLFTLQLNVPYFGLAYRILKDGLDELADWSDLVSGIDIFISAPIYTYDQSKDIKWRPFTGARGFYGDATYDTELSTSGRPTTTVAPYVFVGHYADSLTGKYIDHTAYTGNLDPTTGETLANYDSAVVRIAKHEQFIQNIQDSHLFYKLAEISLSDIKAMTEMSALKISDKDLSSLVTRPTLTDDYQSHCNLVASSLYAFNNRLNLSGVKIAPAEPFPMRSVMQFGNPDGLTTTKVRIKVWTRLNGTKCVATHTGDDVEDADTWYYPQGNFPRYIYYPDASAYKMEIYITESQKYTIDLKPHDFLNGAYYFLGEESLCKETVPTNAEPETAQCATSVSVGSKIYTSEVDNPFSFPLLGINTVGTGEILSICSAAKALSQGQFGQFPLYAFTTEGVWALETTSTGTYSAKQPITRDVCINPHSITQIDSSVLFATDRGIMLISGSQTQSISDVINSEYPFDVRVLPHISDLHQNMVSDWSLDRCIPTKPFSQFLRECRMIYDYVHQRIIVYNPSVTYAYVFSLKSKQWGMMHSDIVENVPSYPNALGVQDYNSQRHVVDFGLCDDENTKGLLISRPLKLEAPDVLKTIDTVIQRGHFQKGHVQSVLYGSRDLYNWHLVWSSKDHYLRGFRGTPYKYFRIALLCDLSPDESIFGASLQFNPRHTDQPR